MLFHSAFYALSYINVARLLVSDQDIETITNMHAGELHKELQNKQDRIVRKMHKKYPNLRSRSSDGGRGGASATSATTKMGTGWLR